VKGWKGVLLASVGTILLLSQIVVQARNGDVSAVLTAAGLAALGVPAWNAIKKNGNGGGN
jgi:hypothetical protein